MERKTSFVREYWVKIIVLAVSSTLFAFLAGCGSGSDVTMTGGSEADQADILEVVETDAFFVESVTETDEDEEAASEAQANLYDGQVPIQSLSATSGTAELPRFWWRGDLERLGREIDIHIENGIADVKVSHDIAGTFFIADEVGDVMVLWGKPFEDLVTRYARFTKEPWGWVLSAISPVEFALAEGEEQTVFIEAFRAYSGDELVWEATEPSSLYTVTSGLPIFTHGAEIRVEATVSNTSESGWEPSRYVFLHRPGPYITGRRTRNIMFDDGTNGDLVADDGIYTRIYTIGPCRGRHFAAVDVIDAATFMELEAPYNSGAWGMPYIVE
jgi:hypothetical protein